MTTVQNEPSLCLQLLKASDESEILVRRLHEPTFRSRPFEALNTPIHSEDSDLLPETRKDQVVQSPRKKIPRLSLSFLRY